MEEHGDYIDKVLNRKSGFQHVAVDARAQVRLLRAVPDVESGTVRYSLEAFNIADLPSTTYRSLSYTWGSARDLADLRVIDIDSYPFFVRRNLHDFLCAAAVRGEHGLYFIDAICINQNDAKERRDQVARMSLVYRRANAVISWLGEPDEESAGYVQALASDLSLGCQGPSWTSAHWHGLRYLSYHNYWRRVWVVQEVLLASSLTVWCGMFSFPLSIFAASPTDASLGYRELKTDETGRPNLAANISERCRSPAERILSHRTRYVLAPTPDPLAQGTVIGTIAEMSQALQRPVSKLVAYQSPILEPLHRAIRIFGQLDCSDPRDKLYGFLGILNFRQRGQVDIDYTKDVSYAYYQALSIGLAEIYGGEGAIVRASEGGELPYLAFYCEARDAFGIGDEESMRILRQVLQELRFKLRTEQDILEAQRQVQYGWRGSEVRLYPELKQLLRPCEEEPTAEKKNLLYRFHQLQFRFLRKLRCF